MPVEKEFVSTIGNRNVLAAYLVATWFVMLGLMRRPVGSGGWRSSSADLGETKPWFRGKLWGLLPWPWMLGFAASAVLAAGVFMCGSRGAWLALVVGLLVWAVFWGRRGRVALLVGAAALLFIAVLNRSRLVEWWQTDVRPVIWRSTLAMIAARPWTGHGLGVYVAAYPEYRDPSYFQRPKATNVTDHAHNELLHVAAEQGVPAAIILACFWLSCLIRGARKARTEPLYRGLLAAVVVLLVHGALDIGLRTPTIQPVFWLALGMLAGPVSPNSLHAAQRPIGARALVALALVMLSVAVLWWGFWQPLRADWYDRHARIAAARRDVASAAEYAGRALEIQPWRLETRYWLAGLLAESGTIPGRRAAIEQCEELRRWAPHYADVTYNLAHLYTLDGQFARAAALWAEVERTRPDLVRPRR
ncbi:MAG: O-antigen ligase family protein [Verrucomicrobiae bacterium]|nr:O-antigen ligase family protein [Verrucomicrobiae bacterium]